MNGITLSVKIVLIRQEKIYKYHKEIKIPKILLSKPEFNVDFKSVLMFATLFILFDVDFKSVLMFATLFILFDVDFKSVLMFATLFILFDVDFKSVLMFATLFILFETLAFECTKVSQKIMRTAILDFSVFLPVQDMTYFVR